jgi:hypothetical protein
MPQGTTETKKEGTVAIYNLRGGTSNGSVRVLLFTVQPMELQIIGKKTT